MNDGVGCFSDSVSNPLNDDIGVLAGEVVRRCATPTTSDGGEGGEDARREDAEEVNGQQADERERCCCPGCKLAWQGEQYVLYR